MKTFITKPAEVERQWFIVDAEGQTLGRLASRIATILRGKHTLREQLEKFPTRPVEAAVKGMLHKNKLGRKMIKKLKVYAGEEHPHQAQQPVPMEL